MNRSKAILAALAVEPACLSTQSRRCLFLSLVLCVLYGSWVQAFAFLEDFGRHPFDGSLMASEVTLTFTTMGLVIGFSIGTSFVLSRHLLHRMTLSAVLGAAGVMTLVAFCGVDCFSTRVPDNRYDELLDYPEMWAIALGGPVCSALAVSIHLLRRTSGKFLLTMAACVLSSLLGLRAQWEFWELWGGRAFSGSGACGTAVGNLVDGIAGTGRENSLLLALCVAQGVLLLDLGSRWIRKAASEGTIPRS